MTDIDRMWFEIRRGKPFATFDLKWPSERAGAILHNEDMKYTEKELANWFTERGVYYFIVVPLGIDKRNPYKGVDQKGRKISKKPKYWALYRWIRRRESIVLVSYLDNQNYQKFINNLGYKNISINRENGVVEIKEVEKSLGDQK